MILFALSKALFFINLSPLSITACNDREIKVGIEATGHYSYNILGFLLGKDLPTFVLNPLQTNQFRKSLILRKTKTDKVDSILISRLTPTPLFKMKNLNLLLPF